MNQAIDLKVLRNRRDCEKVLTYTYKIDQEGQFYERIL